VTATRVETVICPLSYKVIV